jgi:restriction endonuclease
METGTGKTYVYLRTVFEMNRLYGFTKFIIVVPSIAIKEGVQKSLKLRRLILKSCTKTLPSTISPTIPVSCRMCVTCDQP